MSIRNIITKNEMPLTGYLYDKVNKLLNKPSIIMGGVLNNNSNIRVFKTLFHKNDTPTITFTNGNTYLDKNIFNNIKINNIAYDNGTAFVIKQFSQDMGEFTINTSFPTPVKNINGNNNVYGIFYNDGEKAFWSNISAGIAVNNFSTSDFTFIPKNLNNNIITYTGDNKINYFINGTIILNNENCSINFAEKVNSINSNEILYVERINVNNVKKIADDFFVDLECELNNIQISNSDVSGLYNIILLENSNTNNSNIKSTFSIGDYLLNGDYENLLLPNINKNMNNNIIYNHYHDRYEKQTLHYFENNGYIKSYNSNIPIGSIIWWPHSWISKTMTTIEKQYHKLMNNKIWAICNGTKLIDQQSLYTQITGNKNSPNLALTQYYSYYNIKGLNSVNVAKDHYVQESYAAWLKPQTIRIHPISFTSTGTFYYDQIRRSDFYKGQDGYGATTRSTYADCVTTITFRINKTDIPVPNNSEMYLLYDVDSSVEGLITKYILLNNNTQDQQFSVSVTGKRTNIYVHNFRIKIQGNVTSCFVPTIYSVKEVLPKRIYNSYRYGFITTTRSIIAIGFTNYGYFRQLVPYIKINNDGAIPDVPIPPEIEEETGKTVSVKLIRKGNIDVTKLGFNNFSLYEIATGKQCQLKYCYLPNGEIKELLKNNIVNFNCYKSEEQLKNLPSKENQLVIYGEQSNYYTIYQDAEYYYFKKQNEEDIFPQIIDENVIISNLNPFFTYNSDSSTDSVQYSNFDIKQTNTDTWEIQYNYNLIKMYNCYNVLQGILRFLQNLPTQCQSGYFNGEDNDNNQCSGFLHYAVSANNTIYGNLPFYNNNLTKQLDIDEIISSYYLYGSNTGIWNVNDLTKDLSNYTIKSYFPAGSFSQISQICDETLTYTAIIGRFPSSYIEGLTHNIFSTKVMNAVKNESETLGRYYLPSLTFKERTVTNPVIDYPYQGKYVVYSSIKIPKGSVGEIDLFDIETIDENNFDSYIAQYDQKFVLKTQEVDTIPVSDIKSAYNYRMLFFANKLINGINYVLNLTSDDLINPDILSSIEMLEDHYTTILAEDDKWKDKKLTEYPTDYNIF